jgi:hypothetical protein
MQPFMKLHACLLFGLFLWSVSAPGAEPFISEFMADNDRTLADDDGQFVDWLEIHNPNTTAINLQGYHLTDHPARLDKWTFPAVTLPAGGYLVVFASGKDRTNDPAHLHTSFELNAEGGYLALVNPGSNIVSAFTSYPAVKEDVAFGIAQQQVITSLLAGSTPQILVPMNAAGLPPDWNQPAFVPGAIWTNGLPPPAVGFDTNLPSGAGTPVNVAPGGTAVQSTVNGAFTPDLAINGNLGDFTHTLGTDPAPFWQVTFTNELAVHRVELNNRTSCCGSRLRDITVEILSTNESGTVTNYRSVLLNPENAGFVYPAGPPVIAVDLVALTGSPVIGRTVRVRRTPDPDLSGSGGQGNTDEMAVLALGEVVVLATGTSDYGPSIRTDLGALMLGKNASAFVRLPFNVPAPFNPDLFTFPIRYDDGFVAYLNGTEIARRNAPGTLAWDSAATEDRASSEALIAETIDLTGHLSLLSAGPNVLAIQVLNSSSGNGDLLLVPELIGIKRNDTTNVFLTDATPGTRNDTEFYFDEVGDTHFSVDRGFFDTPFSLSITSGTPDAVIYYSFNADEPGPTKGFLYTNAITITNTTILRARAFKAGWKATDVDTATYVFLNDVIYQAPNWQQTRVPPTNFPATWGPNTVDYGMDPNVVSNYSTTQWREALTQLPTMSVVTEMPNLFDAATGIYANALQQGEVWERPASIELLDPANPEPGRFQENCGLRIRGGFSRNPQFVKHAFRIFFRREYGAGKLNYPLFENEGAQEFDKFDLRTSSNYAWARESSAQNGTNDTNVREVWSRQTLGAMGQPYRRSRYYHLYLNGQYWGIYETDERPEASYGATYFGGAREDFDVVKCGNRGTDPDFITEATDGNLVAFSNLWTMCRTHAATPTPSNYFRILGRNPDGTRNPELPVMVDVDNLIDYMLGIFFTGDGDATLSAFLANNRPNNWFGMRDRANPNQGFRFFNSDCEHTLGAPSSQVDRTGPFRAVAGSNIGNFLYANPQYMHEDLMWSEEYRQLFADHVQKHFFNGGALTLEQCTNRWWAKANQLTKAIRANSARWGDAVREPPYGESDWTNIIRWVANAWFPPRANIVLAQLRADSLFPSNAAPLFSQFGGAVPAGYNLEMSHTNTTGVLYFTTDGTDPRAIGGGVSASAQAYSAPLTINTPTLVRARVLTGTIWSALLEYTFFPPQDLSKLLITEIMYHPPAAGLVDGDEFEFLELKNAGNSTLNLSGLKFSGITYAFPNGTMLAPGQFFLLGRNATQFANKYPGRTLNGVFGGGLANSGETVTLSHPLGGEVLSVTFADLAPWPITPDDHGFSLVPVNPNANPDPNNAANWRASSFVGGSPGADDPASTVARVLINEVLSHSETGVDFIELFNPGATPAEIGGWFLTDDPGRPHKYRIEDGTEIAPLSYLVFDETQFNFPPGAENSFSLNARGDDVYLFSGDANTNLTGYSHGFSFGAAPDGASFGRYVISTGEEQFPEQLSSTPNQPNAGPRIGPVVLNEILYHPSLGGDEFIELKNLTTNTVRLYDPAHPTNTWKLTGAAYTFPTNLVLGSNQLLLIVALDPATFRAKYGVPASVPILGPYSGVLQDSGERLELQRPDLPDTNGVAYITVDEVRYNDKAPWPPAADGSGPSLQRKSAAAYGNDSANWEAAIATPGAEFPGGQSPTLLTQPQSQTALIGQTVVFSVNASGPGVLNYQWRFNGNDLTGANSSSLVLNNVSPPQAGSYSVVVFNQAGSVASAIAQLTVRQPPLILATPTNQFVRPGSNAVFTVSASGNGFPRYRWRFNGETIALATNATLTVTNAQFANEGDYTVTITDSVGQSTTSPAKLFILINPTIVQPPLSQMVVAGATVTLSIGVTGNPTPFSYEWRRGSLPLVTNVLDSRMDFLTITASSLINNTQQYRVIVRNAAYQGTGTNSLITLITLADSDSDGIPDVWESAYGFATNNLADGVLDPDGDGMSNRSEYIAGTDPTDPLSYLKIGIPALNGGVDLTFGAVSNRTYTVRYTDAVDSGAWFKLADVPARTSNGPEVVRDSSYTTNRFYRLITPRVP